MNISPIQKGIGVLSVWLLVFFSTLAVGGCGDDDKSDRSATNSDLSRLEQSVFSQINQYRQSQGFSALVWDETIATYCRIHSMDMATGRTAFGHDGFQERIDAISGSLSVSAAAENVAYNNHSNPDVIAVNGWLDSRGHLENIEGDYDVTGVGVALSGGGNYYFTQIFIR